MYPKKVISALPEKSATALASELLDVMGASVLDVGCGAGEFTCFLAECGADMSGIDPNEGRLEKAALLAREDNYEIDFRVGVAESLTFEEDTFDIVTFSNSLHHVPFEAIPIALGEAARVLGDEGLLYVMEPIPSGSNFEVGQPINDETDVRTIAYEALGTACDVLFEMLSETFASAPKRYRDFEDFRIKSLARNPQRTELFDQHQAEMTARFDRLAEPAVGGFILDAAVRVNLLRKVG